MIFRALKKFFFTNSTEFSIGPLLSGSAFIAHPEPDALFCIEIFKDSGLDDLTRGLAENKHGNLINYEFLRTAS